MFKITYFVVALLLVCLLITGGRASAASIGTPGTVVVTVLPSLVVSSPTPTDIPPPTVSLEQSTPIVTAVPAPTTAPVAADTMVSSPTAIAPRTSVPTPTPLPIASTVTVPQAPLLSPAELRANARLRWGKHVPATVRRWAFLIVPAARKYRLDPNLIAAVMTMESGGDPLAWNSQSDARGLMQVLHGPWDPKQNIYAGARMLAGFLTQFHDFILALAAYNAGPNAVLSYGGVPPYRETRDYVIVVSYLRDLYDHHRITRHRRLQYRSTLSDLRRFADQRKKVKRLATIAHVKPGEIPPCDAACQSTPKPAALSVDDPFWPMSEVPDPLQRVDPFGGKR